MIVTITRAAIRKS